MRNGYKVTLSILTIMILMTLTIGTSYSYYSISAEQEEPNVLSTTCFKINFTTKRKKMADFYSLPCNL